MLSLFASGCGLTIPAPAPAPAVMMRVAASPVMPAVAEVDNIFPTSFTLAAGMSDGGSRKVITSFESELDAFEAKQKVADQAVAERKAAGLSPSLKPGQKGGAAGGSLAVHA